MKYILVFIAGAKEYGDMDAAMPGTMHEVDRFDSLEDANKSARDYKKKYGGEWIIMPYYDVETDN